jgi:uncharacterized membrane protein
MNEWALPAALAAVLVAGHYLTLRAAAGKAADGLLAAVVEGTAALILWAYVALVPSARTVERGVTRGLTWSMVSGACIAGMMLLLFAALRRGGPVAATGTLVLGGGVTLAAALSPSLFGDAFTARRALGVGLGLAGMLVLATEPSP